MLHSSATELKNYKIWVQKIVFIANCKKCTRLHYIKVYFYDVKNAFYSRIVAQKKISKCRITYFCGMETNRQKKIGGVLQRDIADVIQHALRDAGIQGILVSVTKVSVTTDLSIAKVYMSVFPHHEGEKVLEEVKSVQSQIKHQVAQRTKHQLRRMPEMSFFIDDSLEYIDNIEKAIKGEENPLQDPNLLPRRKKK